jgi:hypothetical protein
MKSIFKFSLRFLIGLGYIAWLMVFIYTFMMLFYPESIEELPDYGSFWIAGINFIYFLPFPLLKFSSDFKNWMKNK